MWTHEDHREQGHATALYRRAFEDLGGDLWHDVITHRTDDGNRFAERTGGPVRESCENEGCCAFLDDIDDYDWED